LRETDHVGSTSSWRRIRGRKNSSA
jgi:hypothetical protein